LKTDSTKGLLDLAQNTMADYLQNCPVSSEPFQNPQLEVALVELA
jgi:hypothetical protein